MNYIRSSFIRAVRVVRSFAAKNLPLVVLYLMVVIRHSSFEALKQGPEGLRGLILELAQVVAVVEAVSHRGRHSKACSQHRERGKRRVTARRKPRRRP